MTREKHDAPRGVLHARPRTDRFRHQRFLPAPELAAHIEHYWSVAWDLRGEPPFLAETLPHPSTHIVFERGRAIVLGVSKERFTRRLVGRGRVFGIKFRPATFQQLTDGRRSLHAVFGAGSVAFAREILATDDATRCAALSDIFLHGRLPPLAPTIIALRDLVERLARDSSITRVEEAARLAGMDLRKLQRLFRTSVGVGPKWVIQRYRLHEAAERLLGQPTTDLASLALELGYVDQSHFTRDFKAFVGRSPGDFVESRSASSGER